MRRESYPVKAVIVVAFAAVLGHFSWTTWLSLDSPEYFAEGPAPALRSPSAGATALYLRRVFHLPVRPRNGWLRVLARDRVEVYVNGVLVSLRKEENSPVGTIRAIGHRLREGLNVIAIETEQHTFGKPPVVGVSGGYTLADGEHAIACDEKWRCRSVLERQRGLWTDPEFDDRHWERAEITEVDLRARLEGPPRAVMAAARARWIAPPVSRENRGCAQRSFVLRAPPRQGWVRAISTGAYRMAVNGVLVDINEQRLATRRPAAPVEKIYDITALLRRGRNTIAFLLAGLQGRPRLRAGLEIDLADGSRQAVRTDERWTGAPGAPARWGEPQLAGAGTWCPCAAEAGVLGTHSGPPAREWARSPAASVGSVPREVTQKLTLLAAILLAAFLSCRFAGRLIALVGGPATRASSSVAYLPLVPATIAMGVALLFLLDPRVPRHAVYRGEWITLALVSIPLQWLVLALVGRRSRPRDASRRELRLPWSPRPATSGTRVLLALLCLVGFGLRFREIHREPLHHDEIRSYHETLGVLERGYPSVARAGAPLQVIATSELVYYPMAAVALFSPDDRFVVRFPGVCFGTATILLVFLAGRGMFGSPAGIVAAAITTFAPVCVAMSGFGRYPSQLGFFSILTFLCFWRVLTRPDDRRAPWLAAISFSAMFLSWQGSALVAVGMVAAALVDQRGRLRELFCRPALWGAMLSVGGVVGLHLSHRNLQAARRLYTGSGISNLAFSPMWRFGDFDLTYYFRAASWSASAILPLLALGGSLLLAVRHGFRRPTRVLGISFVVTGILMTSFIPVRAFRYAYHLVPLAILLASAALIAAIRSLSSLVARRGAPAGWSIYARGIGIAMVCVYVAMASGAGQIVELSQLRATGYSIDGIDGIDARDHPDVEAAAAYLREHFQSGDVVLASKPHALGHYLRDHAPDYWLQTRLQNRVMLCDGSPVLHDRRSTAVLVSTREELEDIFSRYERIWYVFEPYSHRVCNDPAVSSFLRQHMDVVYRDFASVVLFRGDRHRPSAVRLEDELEMRRSPVPFFR